MGNTEEYEFNGFKYFKDYDNETNSNLISYEKEKPKFIFKYYSISEYSIGALIDGYFYASHPIELNDCLDSNPFLLFTSKALAFEQYEKQFGVVYENIEELIDFWKEDISQQNRCQGFITQMYNIAFNLMGIVSMTEKENNTLMWPHYTQERGFQLKFKTEKLEKSVSENVNSGNGEFLGLYPINYVEKLNPIDIQGFKSLIIPFMYATNVKSRQWQYEMEWRFLISNHNMGVPFSKSGLNVNEDYYKDISNRYVKYDSSLIEEVCLAVNFFTKQYFEIQWNGSSEFQVKPKKFDGNYLFDSHVKFLDFVSNGLSDKLYYSGTKYELDENEMLYVIRTKEKLEIQKQDDGSYLLRRTFNFKEMID